MVEAMTLNEVESPQEVKGLEFNLIQLKFDGNRAMIHVKNGVITAIRDGYDKSIASQYPELINAKVFDKPHTAIIDGEMCVLNEGKSLFIGGIDHRRKSNPPDATIRDYPVTFVAFDLLYVDAENLLGKPCGERFKRLTELLNECTNAKINLVKSYHDFNSAWQDVVDHDYEGVVFKHKLGIYEPGKRSASQVKLKNRKDATVTFTMLEENTAGAKLSNPEGDEVQAPGKDRVALIKDILAAKGKIDIEISYQEKTPSGKYRQPTFKRIAEVKA